MPQKPAGQYQEGLATQDLAASLAIAITLFCHLEATMAIVMRRLLGGVTMPIAEIVLNAIKSPKGRIEVLNALIAERPNGDTVPRAYADLIKRFYSINQRRNAYVHGLWWQYPEHPEFGSYLSEIGQGFDSARLVEVQELKDFTFEMNALWFQIQMAEKLEMIGEPLPEPPRLPGAPTP